MYFREYANSRTLCCEVAKLCLSLLCHSFQPRSYLIEPGFNTAIDVSSGCFSDIWSVCVSIQSSRSSPNACEYFVRKQTILPSFQDGRYFRGDRYNWQGDYRSNQRPERSWGNSYQQHRQGQSYSSHYGQYGYNSYNPGPRYHPY
uniref:Uncharacterized protein n=1 Tax=Accipiter nisus TaxID=211598 RepID=A0A8B9N9D5_9AVES